MPWHSSTHHYRPCSTFRWKGIATSANRSPCMYSYVTQWAYLSQRASSNSQCTKLTKKLVEVTDVTVLQKSPRGSMCILRNYVRTHSLETRPSPSSTRACSVSYNYAWKYFRRQKAWYILSRDACRDCHKASSYGAVT